MSARTTTHPLAPRRTGLPGLMVTLLAAVLLVGCSSAASQEAPKSAGAAGTSGTSGTSGQTRTINDTFTGTVTGVPAQPKRVLALWRAGSELADLDVVPVGALQGEFSEAQLGSEVYKKFANVPSVGSYEGVDIEKVIELAPDLIVGMDNGGLKIDYKQLSQIAPTVILKVAEPTDVWANYPKLADVVGKKTDFAQQQKRLEKELASVKDTYGKRLSALQTTALGSTEGSIWVSTSKSLTYDRLTAAGFGYNPTYEGNPERYAEALSHENIPSLASQDAIFYEVDIHGKASPDMQQILDSPSFKRLPAVTKGHAFPLTSGTIYTFAAGQGQVDSLRKAAEQLAKEKN